MFFTDRLQKINGTFSSSLLSAVTELLHQTGLLPTASYQLFHPAGSLSAAAKLFHYGVYFLQLQFLLTKRVYLCSCEAILPSPSGFTFCSCTAILPSKLPFFTSTAIIFTKRVYFLQLCSYFTKRVYFLHVQKYFTKWVYFPHLQSVFPKRVFFLQLRSYFTKRIVAAKLFHQGG